MTDPRIATVAAVLTDTGAVQGPDDTDTIATKIVNALDVQAAAADTDTGTSGTADATDAATPSDASDATDATEATEPVADPGAPNA